MNNDYYKKAIDQIHPSDDLRKKTLEKMVKNKKKRTSYIQYMTACVAMIFVVCIVWQNNLKNDEFVEDEKIATETKVEKIKNDLPRFKSMQQLRDILEECEEYRYTTNGAITESITDSIVKSDSAIFDLAESSNKALATSKEFSTTNVQVENVDEADIVKTDGDYIYYVTNNKVLIIEADTLEIVAIIDENEEETNESFSTHEIFVKDNILVTLGNNFQYQETKTRTTAITESAEAVMEDVAIKDVARVRNTPVAKAIVYDISDRLNPVIKREIELDGYYSNSRMIGDYVYFISTKNAYYTSLMKDAEILPFYRDTSISQEKVLINYTDIAYFEGTNNYNFTLVAGFNIQNQEEISLETFLGASNTIYASEKNLYLAQVTYNQEYYNVDKSSIYKFNLEDRTNYFTMQRRSKRRFKQSIFYG